MDLQHMQQDWGSNFVPIGIDLKEFYLSVEWDILEVPARRNEGKIWTICKLYYDLYSKF